MKVIFLEHVLHVWKKWEIKEVASAYASNFLIPKNLAKKVTPEMEKNFQNKQRKAESQRREILGDSHAIAEKLNGEKLVFHLGSSPSGKVFWGIGEKDIIEAVHKKFHVQLTKKHIEFANGHIKTLWEHFVYIKLSKDAIAKVLISVLSL